MKVVMKSEEFTVGELIAGDVFRIDKCVYIKGVAEPRSRVVPCWNVTTSRFVTILGERRVKPCPDAILILEK